MKLIQSLWASLLISVRAAFNLLLPLSLLMLFASGKVLDEHVFLRVMYSLVFAGPCIRGILKLAADSVQLFTIDDSFSPKFVAVITFLNMTVQAIIIIANMVA